MTTSTSPPTALDWARENGQQFLYRVQLGASPGRVHYGSAWHYTHPDDRIGLGLLIGEAKKIPDAHQAIYTLDRLEEMEVSLWYPAGWHDEQDVMFLHEVSIFLLDKPHRCYHLVEVTG